MGRPPLLLLLSDTLPRADSGSKKTGEPKRFARFFVTGRLFGILRRNRLEHRHRRCRYREYNLAGRAGQTLSRFRIEVMAIDGSNCHDLFLRARGGPHAPLLGPGVRNRLAPGFIFPRLLLRAAAAILPQVTPGSALWHLACTPHAVVRCVF